ncbi:MAG: trehalose-phosphatase [Betaproteobacteria bacterium]
MQVLSPRIDWTGFLEAIPAAASRVLMLDYDGTLAPFQPRPERALPYPGVREVLASLIEAASTRIVIISGRPAADVTPLLGLGRPPEIWGGHGWERLLPNGELRIEEPSPAVKVTLEKAAAAAAEAVRTGGRLERKRASVALHWRGLPTLTAAKVQSRARAVWESFLTDDELQLLPFDGGLELRAAGCNKQHAVKAVLSETVGDSAIAYLGDDLTDEDAFAAVKPRGLAVLVRPELRATQADVWLQPPRELIAFLHRWRVQAG